MIRAVLFSAALALFFSGCTTAITTAPAVALGAYELSQKNDRLRGYAKKGDVYAMYELGESLCCGDGEYYNTREAMQWLCMAGRRNFAKAQLRLAEIYDPEADTSADDYIAKDPARALMWYSLAARQSLAPALAGRNRISASLEDGARRNVTAMMNQWKSVPCGLEG